jgi:ribosomal-protein-alanine N-acetyltransferase
MGLLVYRRAEREDTAELMRLSAVCGGAPQWSEAVWGDAVAGEPGQRVVWVVERDARTVGFAVAARVGEIAELESVAVMAEERRRGVGRELCWGAMRWAAEQGARMMELEVRASSEGARALYAAVGFVEQGRRRGYYRAPVEDAVLMTARL